MITFCELLTSSRVIVLCPFLLVSNIITKVADIIMKALSSEPISLNYAIRLDVQRLLLAPSPTRILTPENSMAMRTDSNTRIEIGQHEAFNSLISANPLQRRDGAEASASRRRQLVTVIEDALRVVHDVEEILELSTNESCAKDFKQ